MGMMGWVVFSIPWRGERFGLVILPPGDRWFLGLFTVVSGKGWA
jgi:hypothetical protein